MKLMGYGIRVPSEREANSNMISNKNVLGLPHFNVVYKLLNPASHYHPISNGFGIDLGITSTALAIHRHINNKYYLEIIRNTGTDGTESLYSWVAFDQKEPYCGKLAFDRFKDKSRHMVYDAKKLIGKRYDEIQKLRKSEGWPFEVADDGGNVKIIVKGYDMYDNQLTPEQVYAYLLECLKKNAKEIGVELEAAVFTIPAKFTRQQKMATRKAAELAGIKVLQFLPEPIAAALGFCSRMENAPENGAKIFIFHLGGETTDISIFNIQNGQLFELCHYTNENIGGSNFTKVLYDYFIVEFKDQGYDILAEGEDHELLIRSMEAKEKLTTHPYTKYVNLFIFTS